MNKKNYYRALLVFSSLYDWFLGAAFMFFYVPVFNALGVELPANISYMLLAAAFVFVSGFLYWFALKKPQSSRELVKMGAIYKFFYAATGVYCLATGQLPHFIFLVFGVADSIFLLVYLEFLSYTAKNGVSL